MSNLIPSDRLNQNGASLVPVEFYSIDSKETDADSFSVRDRSGRSFGIRLAGIDAPEIAHNTASEKTAAQKYGDSSTETLRRIAGTSAQKNQLFLRFTGEETYGRRVSEAFIQTGSGQMLSLNQELVRQKAAYLYTDPRYYNASVATPEIRKLYWQYTLEAFRGGGTGIYSPDASVPSEFRHRQAKLFGVWNVSPRAIGEENYQLLSRFGLVEKLTSIGDAEGGKIAAQAAGYTNAQVSGFFHEGGSGFILPSRRGLSYFYELALFNAGRMNAGQAPLDPAEMSGYATAAYTLRYAATHGTGPDRLPQWVTQYDREMNTPGLGFYLNQWGIAQGYGRLYQDEKGALASVAGLVGSVFDRAFTYYNSSNPDWSSNFQELGGSEEPPKTGFFQSTGAFAANFLIGTSTAVLTYFTLGMPYEVMVAEATRMSLQGMLDTALGQGRSGVNAAARAFSSFGALGIDYAGMSSDKIREKLLSQVDVAGEIDLYKGFTGIPGIENTLQRRRAGILYDHILKPFLLDVVNPYPVSGDKGLTNPQWQRFQFQVDHFGRELRERTKLKLDESGNFVLINEGFSRKQAVARSLDELAMMIPANPMKWGWKGINATNPSQFLSMGDLFSFSQLVQSIESIYFDSDIGGILARSERVNEQGGSGRMVARIKSLAQFPGAIIGAGLKRLKESQALLGPIMGEHRKLRVLQENMIRSGNLSWDDDLNSRRLSGEIEPFLEGLMTYQSEVSKDGIRESKLTDRATRFFDEQKLQLNKLKYSRGTLKSHALLNHRGLITGLIAGVLGGEMILSDFLGTTGSMGAASLWSQLVLSLHHNEAAPAQFTPTYLFSSGNRILDVAAWTGAALAGGYGIARITQGVQVEKFVYGMEIESQIARWSENATQKIGGKTLTGPALKEYVEGVLERGILRPKGNFFRNFAVATTTILAAGRVGNWLVSSGLNLLRSIPGIGSILGKGEIEPNNNLTVVTQWGALRGSILRRFAGGESISDVELSGAYQAGIFAQMTSVIDRNQNAAQVRVLAEQAPLPFFQFFMTETIKGRTFNDENKVQSRGISTFTYGIQTPPVLGGNLSFGLPVAINWDAQNRVGMSLVYNDQANVLGFVNALASFNLSAYSLALGAYAAVAGTRAAMKLFGSESGIVDDLNLATRQIKNSVKLIDKSLDVVLSLPETGINAIRGFKGADVDAMTQLVKSTWRAGQGSNSFRWVKGLALGALSVSLAQAAIGIFTDDSRISWGIGTAVGVGLTGALAINPVHEYLADQVAPKSYAIFNRVKREFDQKLLSRLPKRYLGVGITIGAAAWLMSDSSFGVTKGMDRTWEEKISTVGLYTALMTPILVEMSDLGRSVKDTAIIYEALNQRIATPARNPLQWTAQQLDKYKAYKLRGDLTRYASLSKEFVETTYGSTQGNMQELLGRVKADTHLNAAFETIRDRYNTQVSEFFDDSDLSSSFKRVVATEEFQSFIRGRGRLGSRLFRGAVAVAGVTSLTQMAIQTIGTLRSGVGVSAQGAVTAFYNWTDGIPVVGTAIGNLARLLSWRDREASIKGIDLLQLTSRDVSGKPIRQQGQKLLKLADPQAIALSQTLSDLLAPLAVDPANPYQSLVPGMGMTFRDGEYGSFSRTGSYLQIQSAGQDVSTAVYSMAQATLVRSAVKNKGELRFILESTYKRITGQTIAGKTTPEQDKALSSLIQSATAELQPLKGKQRRRFSTPVGGQTRDFIGGDTLLSMALKSRMRSSVHLSYARRENIAARMTDLNDPSSMLAVSNQLDPTSLVKGFNRLMSEQDQELTGARSNYGALISLLLGGRGQLDLRAIAFGWDRKKQQVQSNSLAIEDASEWSQYDSVYLDQAAIEKANTFSVFAQSFQNVDQFLSAMPILGNDLVKTGLYLGIAGVGIWSILGLIGSFAYQQDSAAVLQALEVPRRLFQLEDDKLPFRIGDNFQEGNRRVVIQRGASRFSLDIPEEMSRYFDFQTGKSLIRVQKQIGGLTQTLIKDVFEVADQLDWKNVARSELVGTLNTTYTRMFEGYVNSALDSILNTEITRQIGVENSKYTLGSIIPGDAGEIRSVLKEKLRKDLSELFEAEISKGGTQLLDRYKLRSEKEMSRYLGMLVFQKTQDLFKQIQSRLLVLTPDDLTSSLKLEYRVKEIINQQGGFINGSRELGTRLSEPYLNTLENVEVKASSIEGLETIRSKSAGGKLNAWRTLGRVVKTGLVVTSLLEPLDIFGAYSRLSAIQEDPNTTTGDERYARQHAGWVTTNSVLTGVMGTLLFHHVPKLLSEVSKTKVIASIWAKLGTKGVVGVGLAAGISLLAIGWAARKKLTEGIELVGQNRQVQSGIQAIGNAYDATSDFFGDVLGEYIPSAVNKLTLGLIPKSKVTSAVGGVGAGIVTALALAGLVSLGTGALMATGAVMGIGAIGGAVGLGLSLIPGFSQVAGSLIGKFMDGMHSSLSKIHPLLGGLAGTPSDTIATREAGRFRDKGPIFTGTAQQALQMNWKELLVAASDHTGQATSQLMTNPSLYGQAISELDPAANLSGIRPRNLMNPMIEREIAIRSQISNQLTVGRAMWSGLIQSADQYQQLKQMNQYSKGSSDYAQLVQRRIEGQKQQELEQLKIKAATIKSPKKVDEAQISLAATLYQTIMSWIQPANQSIKQVHWIANATFNPNLHHVNQQMTQQYGKAPVVAIQKQVNRAEGSIQLAESIAPENDVIANITRGLVRPTDVVYRPA